YMIDRLTDPGGLVVDPYSGSGTTLAAAKAMGRRWLGTEIDPERIVEAHGAIDWMQCTEECGAGLFSADDVTVTVEEATMRAGEPLPACPKCGVLAQPNILMLG